MYEFCYDCIKLKYQDRAKLCYMDTESVIINIKTEYFYEDIAINVEKLLTYLTMIQMIKDHFRQVKNKKKGNIMKEFAGFRAKTYSYLMDDNNEKKKLKEQRNAS